MKKRILSLLLAAALLCSLLPVLSAFADDPTTYNLTIAGTPVTSDNADDILGDGVFSYDAGSNKLTVKGDCSASGLIVSNRIAGLTMYVATDAVLKSAGGVIRTTRPLTITGPGKLTARTTDVCSIYVQNGTTLTLEDVRVDASGKWGIAGDSAEKLVIRNSSVHAVGTSGAICDLGSITLEGCALLSPENGRIGDSVTDENGNTVRNVSIGTAYDLWIGGVQVTSLNASDIQGDGVFSYDAGSNKLTVKGDCSASGLIVSNRIAGLTMYVATDAVLKSAGGVIRTTRPLTITGPGKLTARTTDVCSIYVQNGTTLTLEDVRVDASGKWGIAGDSAEKLVIRNSSVHAVGTSGAICDLGSITLEGCALLSPENGRIGDSVTDENGNTVRNVSIGTAYDLWIGGVQVTSLNASDIQGDGVFAYDPASKTLTVNKDGAGSSIDYSDPVIESEIPGLTIKIAKPIDMQSSSHCFVLKADTKITGTAQLGLYPFFSYGSNNAILVQNGATLTIDHANVYVGTLAADAIKGSGEETLILQGCVLKASVSLDEKAAPGLSGNAVSGFKEIRVKDCELTEPEGGSFDTGAVRDGEGYLSLKAVFTPPAYKLWIGGVQATSLNASDIQGDGVFAYDPASKTLTVNKDGAGSSIDYSDPVIESEIPGLTIKIAKPIDMQSSSHCFVLKADTKITGTAQLGLYPFFSYGSNNAILVQNGATLTIDHANVYVGTLAADAIKGSGEETLILQGCVLKASVSLDEKAAPGLSGNAVSGFKEIRVKDCELTVPEGGSFDTGAVRDGEGYLSLRACFEPKGGYVNPFTDVSEDKFYYTAVLWAFYHEPQITNGATETTFNPEGPCTRGQVVTFLWRAAGTPEPKSTSHPFTDVKETAFYYKAVLWAVENNITTGASKTTFAPGKPCTRGQIVTFLWRYKGSPEPKSSKNPFSDVSKSAFYYKAVLWAVENKITSGTGNGKFSPDNTCTRGQVVTFLWRSAGSP